MVRRWSYLNQINHQQFFFNSAQPQTLLAAHQTVTFKTTTYYRKHLYSPTITKLVRRAFFRRKHLNNWLVYQNILSYWAVEYLFFRRYSRVLLALSFYKNTYLMYNVLVFSNLAANNLVGFESFFLTNLVRNVTRYCSFGGSTLLPFLKQFSNTSWFYASLPSTWADVQKNSNLKEDPIYIIAHSALTESSVSVQPTDSLQLLFGALSDISLRPLIDLYQLFVLLTLRKVV